jgi:rhodanese-related sulfurtransferase
MNLFKKLYSPWLGLLVIAGLILVLAFIFRPESSGYKLNATESLKLLEDQSLHVTVNDLSQKQLIDVRSPELFSQGHPDQTINIPVRQLLDKESLEILGNLQHSGKEVVLYGTDELQATAPYFLLQQMGFRNIKLLRGGYTALNGFKEPDRVSTEVSVITKEAIQAKEEILTAEKVQKPKSETVIPVRKRVSSGGGC